ncbi:MAG: copper homeostasis protein CutC [Propionibacteriaceae bacterium]|nr:copper homeostasis protein CutC [Propionibacteriaceae bacterium]
MAGFLEVRVETPAAAARAAAAGADRLLAVRAHEFGDGCPLPDDVAAIRQVTTVNLRVLLRLRDGYSTGGGELARLRGLIWSYLAAGADGFCFGFLNGLGQVDAEVCKALAADGDWPWTFDRAVDAAFDPSAAWAALPGLPRLDSVLTAGSARGLRHGLDKVLGLARDPKLAPLITAAGGLAPEDVPWLVRAGVRRFHIGDGGEPGESDDDRLRTWRRLIDGETARAASPPRNA